MKITQLTEKEVQTKYGLKKKWLVTVLKDDRTEFMFDSWQGNWNTNWEVGTDLNTSKEQWKSREWQGKTYWTLTTVPLEAKFEALEARLAKLEEVCLKDTNTPQNAKSEATDDIPIINPNDAPF